MNTNNRSIVRFDDGREICLSYNVPVAAFIPADYAISHGMKGGYVRTASKYSVTTSRHANSYAGRDSAIVPAEVFARLVSPLEVK